LPSAKTSVNPHKYWLRGLLTQKDERASFTKFKQLFVANCGKNSHPARQADHSDGEHACVTPNLYRTRLA
jgi:hypothetical protein